MAYSKEEHEILATLVKIADQLDQEDKGELAEEVDQIMSSLSGSTPDAITSLAARPKAPLKSLDDEVKKNLIAFLYKADKNLDDSVRGLNEFFSRLRYFNAAYIIEDMGLDDIVKDMSKVHADINEAVKKFYSISYGRKPGKADIEGMSANDSAGTQKPQQFFDAQNKPAVAPEPVAQPVEAPALDHCEQCAEDCGGANGECDCHDAGGAVKEEEVEEFWK